MSEFSTDTAYKLSQVEVFGAERMAALEGHEAAPKSTQHLFATIATIAIEPGFRDHHRILSRRIQRSNSRPLEAQVNPYDVRGFGSTEEDRALATVYGLKNEDLRVFWPRRSLGVGVYEVDETIYVDRDEIAKIYKRFTPIYGNFFRELTAERNKGKYARKLASEEEVLEAIDIIVDAVRYDDKVRDEDIEK